MTLSSETSVLLNEIPRQGAPTITSWTPAAHAEARTNDAIAAAHAEGFAAGRAAAAAESEQVQRQVKLARVALETAATAIQQTSAAKVHLDSTELADLTYGLTETLVGRELASDPFAWRDAVSRALEGVEPTVDVVLRLNPADVSTASASEIADLRHIGDATAPLATVRVAADPTVEVGGCVAEVGPGRIDAQIGSALQRVAAALGLRRSADDRTIFSELTA